jgi:hypothetical protein
VLIFACIAFIVAYYVIPPPIGPVGEVVQPPLGPPVQSYRFTTTVYNRTTRFVGGSSNAEVSIFVNDVPVGVYSTGGVKADISRFIKPGPNKVRIAWTADPDMRENYEMALEVEVKQGESWSPLITRRLDKTTKAGEAVTTIIHHGDTPR